jgi:hypothetical protein
MALYPACRVLRAFGVALPVRAVLPVATVLGAA